MVLHPARYVSRIEAIDCDELASRGIRGVLVDIDNTIMARRAGTLPASAFEWVAEVRARGLKVCLLSNNWHRYVHGFAHDLGVPIVAKALKPLPFGFLAAARTLGLRAGECAVVGDQLFTDVLGGNLVGATTILVTPVSSSDLAHTVVLRRIERVIMAGRVPAP